MGIAIFLLSHILFLDRLPIFNDEALFMHIGADSVAGLRPWWSALLFEGKPGYAISLGLTQLLPIDPLVASRLLSVVFGLITFFTLRAAYQLLFKRKISIAAATIFLATPFLLFFNRMALAESAIIAASAGILYLCLVKKQVLAGIVFGLGWWWKASILSLVPAVVLVWLAAFLKEKKQRLPTVIAGTASLVTAIIVMSPLLALPAYQALPAGEVKSVFRLTELLAFPVGRWWENAVAATQWIVGYLSPGITMLLIVGLIGSIRQKRAVLPLFFFIPLGVAILMGKILAARHIAPAIPAALLLAAGGVTILEQKFRRWGRHLAFLCVGSTVMFSSLLIISPLDFYRALAYVPQAKADFSQYVIGWPSGYGVKEAADWFQANRTGKSTLVIVRTDSGNPEDAIFVYLKNIPGMTVAYLPWVPDIVKKHKGRWGTGDIFFVSRGAQYGGLDGHLKEIIRFNKPLDNEFVGIYALLL